MIKLIASDLDGTLLLNGAQKLSDELYPLIKQLSEMGILFVAASGRQYANMKRLFAPLLDEMGFICENGAMAIRDEKVLYINGFDKELVKEILETINAKEGSEFTCSTKDFYYIMPKTEEYYDLMVNVIGNNCKVISSLDEITESCMKLAVYDKRGMNEEMVKFWKDHFSDRCSVVTSGNAWLDFIPYETNKANGIYEFQRILGIQPEECIVFGDEYNDIEMLKCVPNSFAMSHAKDGVKVHANYLTERVEPVLKKIIECKGDFEEVKKCIQKNV